MIISKDTFMSRGFDDYSGNYNKEFILYVAKFISKDGSETFAKMGVSHYSTKYRFQKDINYDVLETYEFSFPNGILAMGIEAAVQAQWTKKFPIKSFNYTVGHNELFKIEAYEECIQHVIKARQAISIKYTKYIEQELDYVYHNYNNN